MKNTAKTPRDSYFSTSLERGLKVLCLFAAARTRVSLSEISRQLNLNKTSSFRFANTLVRLGYLQRDGDTKQLRLGLRAFALGRELMENFDPIQIIRPLVDKSFEKYRCSIDVALRDGEALLTVYRREARDTLIFQSPTVMRDFHASAVGKAFLAHLDKADLARVLSRAPLTRRTSATLTRRRLLLSELVKTRERGYSLNNEEYVPGLIAVGAPLISPGGQAFGAISFDFAKVGCSLHSIEHDYAPAVVELARDISRMIPAGVTEECWSRAGRAADSI